MGAALYVLTGQYRALMDATVDWETGEVDEGKVPGFQAALANLTDDIEKKMEGCAKALKMMDADMKALDEEEKRLQKRRKSIESSKKYLRKYMTECMGLAGLTKVKTVLFTIFTQDGRESVEIYDESAVPMGLRSVPGPPPPDKALISEKLKAGEEVPGARLVTGERILVVK